MESEYLCNTENLSRNGKPDKLVNRIWLESNSRQLVDRTGLEVIKSSSGGFFLHWPESRSKRRVKSFNIPVNIAITFEIKNGHLTFCSIRHFMQIAFNPNKPFYPLSCFWVEISGLEIRELVRKRTFNSLQGNPNVSQYLQHHTFNLQIITNTNVCDLTQTFSSSQTSWVSVMIENFL